MDWVSGFSTGFLNGLSVKDQTLGKWDRSGLVLKGHGVELSKAVALVMLKCWGRNLSLRTRNCPTLYYYSVVRNLTEATDDRLQLQFHLGCLEVSSLPAFAIVGSHKKWVHTFRFVSRPASINKRKKYVAICRRSGLLSSRELHDIIIRSAAGIYISYISHIAVLSSLGSKFSI